MSIVTIAFPVTRVKFRLQLYKGQTWSVAEHCILDAVVREQRAVDELVSGFRLPRAVIEEALIRLTRVGWIEPHVTADGKALFRASALGLAAAAHEEELPSALRPSQRERWQLFERMTGHVFRVNDLNHIRQRELSNQPNASGIQVMAANLDEGLYRAEEVADIALEEDEFLVSVEPTGEFAADRVALVEVIDGEIVGLPTDREIEDLRQAILEVAHGAPATRHRSRRSLTEGRPPGILHPRRPIHFRPDDLIVGGKEHKDTLLEVLETASTRVIIHSTFLSDKRVLQWWEPMVKAIVERNVQIDILWGQEAREDAEGQLLPPRAQHEAERLAEHPEVIARLDRLRIHPVSTRSHAKIIVSDPHRADDWQAIIGSCNWLDSPFDKVEASVRLRDPGIVSDVLKNLMTLAHGGGPWPELVTELHHMFERLRDRAPTSTPNGEARLVSNTGHNDELLRARDHVEHKLLLVSHRLGAYYDCGALLPLAAACRASTRIDARFLYSKNDLHKERTSSQLEREARKQRITLQLVHEPRLHAKLLAWDEDTIVVTSQNWMSRDPGISNLLGELGVTIDAPGAARDLIELFDRRVRESPPVTLKK
jgi:phosphatidylserine/phosphatidylglycerophosphate/cardiolipin synthase-like enzyme